MSDHYVRPGWTGKPLRYSDGSEDREFAECPSCLGFHAASNLSCNGKRELCGEQCPDLLGEIRCHRPANHLGEHQARGECLHVAWSVHRPSPPGPPQASSATVNR